MDIPVKFEGVVVGYTNEAMTGIEFIKPIPQKLKDLMNGGAPVSVSSRKIGNVDKSGQVGNMKSIEMVIMDNKPTNIIVPVYGLSKKEAINKVKKARESYGLK